MTWSTMWGGYWSFPAPIAFNFSINIMLSDYEESCGSF